MSKLSDRYRKEFRINDEKRDEGLGTPEDIIRYDDISYGQDPYLNLLDVYRPKDAGDKPIPVIVNVHGGGWVYGDKGIYQHYGMNLAQRGFAVVNFSYRLAPEAKFPTQLEDICAVFGWMSEHHKEYGLDLNNVFAVGDSAGAHLLGLFAAFKTNTVYERELMDKYPRAALTIPSDICLRAVALNCGKYNLERGSDEDRDTPLLMNDFLEGKGTKEEYYLTDVIRHVTGNFPPAFIMTCPGDFLKYQAPFMTEILMENKVPFVYRFYGDAGNPLHHVFHCNVRLEDGQKCNDDECEFFRSYCIKS